MKNNKILLLILGSVMVFISIIYLTYFRKVTVSFTAKIGAGVAPISVRIGEKVDEPTLPDNDEYKFVGWYKDGEKFDFNTPIKKNINLEAKWEKKEK